MFKSQTATSIAALLALGLTAGIADFYVTSSFAGPVLSDDASGERPIGQQAKETLDETGREATRLIKPGVEAASDAASDAADASKPYVEDAQNAASDAGEALSDAASDTADAAKPMIDDVKDASKGAGKRTLQILKPGVEAVTAAVEDYQRSLSEESPGLTTEPSTNPTQ